MILTAMLTTVLVAILMNSIPKPVIPLTIISWHTYTTDCEQTEGQYYHFAENHKGIVQAILPATLTASGCVVKTNRLATNVADSVTEERGVRFDQQGPQVLLKKRSTQK